MPKRKQYNGFGSFMKELQDKMKKRGKFVSKKNMPNFAYTKWKELSADEQNEYKLKAQQEKIKAAEARAVSVAVLENLDDIIREKLRNEVKDLLGKIGRQNVVAEHFFMISFNIICKTEPEKNHIPIEVSLLEYSIKEGIMNEYHKFIDPGKIPDGYKFDCIDNSENTHGIPFENFDKASKDYKSIYNDIKEFIKSKGKVVFTLPDDVLVLDYNEQTVSCLNWLRTNAGFENEAEFQVYNLVDLFMNLTEMADDPVDETRTKAILSKTIYDYQPKMGCDWHDKADRNRYCSLSLIRKYSYLFSDRLCELYDIDFIPGKHLPLVEDDNNIVIKANSYLRSTESSENLEKRNKVKKHGGSSSHIIKAAGKSSVFEPDSVDIYGDKK